MSLVNIWDVNTYRKYGINKPEVDDIDPIQNDINPDQYFNVHPEIIKKCAKVANKFTKAISSIKECFPPLARPCHTLSGLEEIKLDKVYRFDNFIIKFSDSELEEEDLFRETIIGLIINKVFPNTQNFVRTIGYVSVDLCQLPNREHPCMYLYTEDACGQTLAHWLKYNFNYRDFAKIINKLFNTLYMAYKELDFTHYDLHLGNVIITLEDFDPVIIDLEASHITYEGGHIGISRMMEVSVLNYTSFWICDIFKILILCVEKISRTKINLDHEYRLTSCEINEYDRAINMLFRLLSYFNQDCTDMSWVMEYLKANPCAAVYMTTENKNAKFSDFMAYYEKNC